MIASAGTRDSVLERITRIIVDGFHPARIVLFGSRARGNARRDSDYDVFVEMPGPVDRVACSTAMFHALAAEGVRRVELTVNSADEYAWRRDDVGCREYDVEREGVVLFPREERAPTRVREAPHAPSHAVAHWLQRVANDFATMERMAIDEDPVWDTAAFHAHQGIEKLLKAVVIATSRRPLRTHELPDLLATCPDTVRLDDRVRRACEELQSTWGYARYGDEPLPTPQQGRAAVAAARTVRELVNPVIERLGRK